MSTTTFTVTPTGTAGGLDSPGLLARLRLQVRRPATDESLTDAIAYQLLSDAQRILYEDVAPRAPMALLSAPTAMTTTDQNIFAFGTDEEGSAIAPFGKCSIYPTLASIPDSPWQCPSDYLDEGTQIRLPNGQTYTGTLYYRGILPPTEITAVIQPSVQPAALRMLLPYKAAELWASLGSLRDGTVYEGLYTRGLSRYLLRAKTALSNSTGAATGGAVTGLSRAMGA